jgi:DNA-binding transcriptional LysR family regulator
MASPLVTGVESLPRTFAQARAQVRPRLRVASTQRTLIEDLPEAILTFGRRHPEIDLCLQELGTEHVIPAVQSGDADLGVTTEPDPTPVDPALHFEEGYRLDLMLVTRRDHPLAQRRSVRPGDLCGFPLVNAPNNIPDPAIAALLEKLGLFRTQPRRVEAYYTATIRRFVELGFGIGLVVGRPRKPAPPNLVERSMSRHFGRIAVRAVWMRGTPHQRYAASFAQVIRERLK